MKKILVTLFATFFATATYAQNYSIGVSGMALYYDASGTETVKSSGETHDKSDTGLAPIPSLFIETELDTGATIGLDIIPYSAKVGDASNSTNNASGLSNNTRAIGAGGDGPINTNIDYLQ